MPYLIGMPPAGGPSTQFVPQIDRQLLAKLCLFDGLSEDDLAQVPRQIRLTLRGASRAPAILGWEDGPFVVSARVRHLMETLEPDTHRFLPIDVETMLPGRTSRPFRTYPRLLSPPRARPLSTQTTEFSKGMGRAGYEISAGFSFLKGTPLVLDQAAIANRCFWRLPRQFGVRPASAHSGISGYFCSDELWRALRAERLHGWEARRRCATATRQA
ncbi:hypothetical protein HGQ98_13735 [Achromobacter ruhlandii]|uniref:Immunity MXAN-0049 protein domain-containing protein n=1 Tax=Achromobacter ruhlandii TaxID=72557 RepID=A0A848NJ54_9BURK|nr:DUF1629 domain-containing protein [Achromobacter ruhlandii]NMU90832.1 hypothetical protein [Achromobacter ruhlandii]